MDSELLRMQWGENIRTAREAAGMTQAGLAKACKVNQSTVAKWEKPRGITPTDHHRLLLAQILGVEAQKLFAFEILAPTA